MYQNLLFDLDGTLTDPGIGITNSVAYALNKWNIQVTDRSELYKFVGPPLRDSFMEYYGFTEEESEQGIAYYREYFKDKGIFENTVYEGIEELLEVLKKKGKRIILATSKPEEFANRILDHFGLSRYFDFVAGATMDGSRGKKSDVIQYAIEHCGIADLSSAVMIGDREYDILGAKTNGMDSIGVTYGYGSRKELEDAGANKIASDTKELLGLLIS